MGVKKARPAWREETETYHNQTANPNYNPDPNPNSNPNSDQNIGNIGYSLLSGGVIKQTGDLWSRVTGN